MLKKALVIVCAFSVFMMSGCSLLGLVSQSDYDLAVGDRDYYIAEYERVVSENDDLETEISDLNDEIATLETEKADLETVLEETLVAYEAAQYPGLDQEVLVEVTDNVALKVRLPEEYKDQGNGTYKCNKDASSIVITVRNSDVPELDMTKSEYEEMLLEMLELAGYDVEVLEVTEYKKTEINGYDVLIIETNYTMGGVEIQQVEFDIEADGSSCAIIYTTSPLLGWYDEFEASVNSIQVGVAK